MTDPAPDPDSMEDPEGPGAGELLILDRDPADPVTCLQ